MFEIRKFDPQDVEAIAAEVDIIDDELYEKQKYRKFWAEHNAKAGPAYTGLLENRIVGVAGIRLTDDGSGTLWAAFSKVVREHPKELLRSARELLMTLIEEYDLKSLIATSKKGFAASQRLLEHLGFVKLDSETRTHYIYVLRI